MHIFGGSLRCGHRGRAGGGRRAAEGAIERRRRRRRCCATIGSHHRPPRHATAMQRADGRTDGRGRRSGIPRETLSHLLGASRNLPPRSVGLRVTCGAAARRLVWLRRRPWNVFECTLAMHSRGKRGTDGRDAKLFGALCH